MLGTTEEYLNAMEKLKQYEALGTVEELSTRVKEEDVLKFYYCRSFDKYLVGRRCGTLYYAEVTNNGELAFTMSRHLPWRKYVIGSNAMICENRDYPSEPIEIGFSRWLKGFMKQRGVEFNEFK